jgi:hypothetical protein
MEAEEEPTERGGQRPASQLPLLRAEAQGAARVPRVPDVRARSTVSR